MNNYINKICSEILRGGVERIYIYPYGEIGMQVHDLLERRYGFHEISLVDNFLCKINTSILSVEELGNIRWDNGKNIVICSSDNKYIYTEIRLALKKYVPADNIVDLCSFNPLCFDTDRRVAAMAMQAREVYRKNIKGCVAEAGVYKGEFAKYINILFPDRKLYLFDSFEGFNPKDVKKNKDNCVQTDEWINDLRDTSVELVLRKMNYPDRIEVRKGFVPDTLRDLEEKFVFVNLDMDLYLPTYEALTYFWSHLSYGGYIFVHDFGNWDGIEAAVNKFCQENYVGYVVLPDAITVAIAKPICSVYNDV